LGDVVDAAGVLQLEAQAPAVVRQAEEDALHAFPPALAMVETGDKNRDGEVAGQSVGMPATGTDSPQFELAALAPELVEPAAPIADQPPLAKTDIPAAEQLAVSGSVAEANKDRPQAPPIAERENPPTKPANGAMCMAEAGMTLRANSRLAALGAQPVPVAIDDAGFGVRLAEAAAAQAGDVTIYTPRYQKLAYPMGDVAPLFGVCTDVVIRAYRTLGIDLQELVQLAGVGKGDANIDHRRTETLRRFFAVHGVSMPVTDFAEDYQPGDIVTYYRPQNRASTAHIAIVSNRIAPSGRPYIVHNRGWGVQLEDALFVDQITGHYRFRTLQDQGRVQLVAAKGELQASRSIRAGFAPRKASTGRRDLCSASYSEDVRARLAILCPHRVAGSALVK